MRRLCGAAPHVLSAGAAYAGAWVAAALCVRLRLCALWASGPMEWGALLFLNPWVLLALGAAATFPVWGVLHERDLAARPPAARLRARRLRLLAAGLAIGLALQRPARIVLQGSGGPARGGKLSYAWNPALGVYALPPGSCGEDCRSGTCVRICANSAGFRGPQLLVRKTARAVRVLLVGDSYVFGSGVYEEDTLRARLALALKLRAPRRWELESYALPGLNFNSYVSLLEKIAPGARPDVVVLGFLRGNDLLPYDVWDLLERDNQLLLALSSGVALAERDLQRLLMLRESRWSVNPDVPPPERVRAAFLARLERLLALRRRLGFRLVVFSYFGREPLFADAERAGELCVLVPEHHQWQDAGREWSIPGDGHPTGAGNTIFALAIAAELARQPEGRVEKRPF